MDAYMSAKEMKERILFLVQKINKNAYLKQGDIRYGNTLAVWVGSYPLTEFMPIRSLYAYVEGVFNHEHFMRLLGGV